MKPVAPHTDVFPVVPWRCAPLVFLLLIVSILAVTWPWAQTFSAQFLEHWDPPFHAWKLEMMAHSILAGHLLPPDGDTNMLYPQTATLYHEALQWPQALVAAPFFALPHANPILIYHVVLLSFWALSGTCVWMLLLALNVARRAALLGALLFTLAPYNVSYKVEFQMLLNFGLPLFFFFVVRFVQRPSIRYACGMAFAWWLQAVGELYQAIFLLLLLPFLAIPILAVHWRWLGSPRRFWIPALCAGILGGGLTLLFLSPYFTLLEAGSILRRLREVQDHALNPLSYFCNHGWVQFLPCPRARMDEMVAYPTLALLLLACAHLIQDARDHLHAAMTIGLRTLRGIRAAALLLFSALTFVLYFSNAADGLSAVYSALPVIAVAASLPILCRPLRRDASSLFLAGLFAGAVFAFFMSLGPVLSIYREPTGFAAPNPLYLWLYEHVGAIQGFRVVSRFSVFVLLFMSIAAAMAWNRIEGRWLRKPGSLALWILPVVLLAIEARPPHIQTAPLQLPLSTPALTALEDLGKPYVLAVVPMYKRYFTSRHMLQIGRQDRLFAYAWGGAFPPLSTKICKAFDPAQPQPEQAALLLRQLWPECLILEDKSISRTGDPQFQRDYAELMADETDVMAEDERFALLRFTPRTAPATEEIRLIRADYLRDNPVIRFRARVAEGGPGAALHLDVNGYSVGQAALTAQAQEFQLVVPPTYAIKLRPNRLRFHAENDAPFHLESFEAHPAAEGAAPEAAMPAECPSWVGHLHHLPPSATPLDIRYGNKLHILGCEILQPTVAPGGELIVRYYFQRAKNMKTALRHSLVTRLLPPSGRWIEAPVPVDQNLDLNDVQCQAHPGIYMLEQAIPIPAELAPADYTPWVLLKNATGSRLRGESDGQRGKKFPLPFTLHIRPE